MPPTVLSHPVQDGLHILGVRTGHVLIVCQLVLGPLTHFVVRQVVAGAGEVFVTASPVRADSSIIAPLYPHGKPGVTGNVECLANGVGGVVVGGVVAEVQLVAGGLKAGEEGRGVDGLPGAEAGGHLVGVPSPGVGVALGAPAW